MKSIYSNQMKSPSTLPGKINLRTQFFKARRLAMALALTGGLFLAAAAQGGQAVITDLGSNVVSGQYVLPTPVSAEDISQLLYDPIPMGSGVGYDFGTTGMGYSWNQGNTSPGDTFMTGNDPVELTAVSFQTGGPNNNNSGTIGTTQPFTLTIYQVSPDYYSCSVVTCYTANGTLTNAGDWLSWTGLAVDLQPNTVYAYGFCEASSSTAGNNWDVLAVDTNNLTGTAATNMMAAQFPNAGGPINYGNASATNYTAAFEIGLVVNPSGPAVPNTPAVYSPAAPLSLPIGIVQGSTTVPSITNLMLVAAVGGQQPFTYQWLIFNVKSNKLVNIPGETGSTLTVNTYTITEGSSNGYAYIAYNPVSTAGVTSAVEWLTASFPTMVDLGLLAAWQGGGAAPPSVGTYDISQMSVAANAYASTSITMITDGGFQNGLWPAQTFQTLAAATTTNVVAGVTNLTYNSGWKVTSLSVKTAGGGNFVLDGGWGNGFAIIPQLYDVAFYSLSGDGSTATLAAGPFEFMGKATESNWVQFTPLAVDLAPNTTYAWVWDLDAANATYQYSGNNGDNHEDIWITGGNPALKGGGAAGGQIAIINAPNAQNGVSGQAIPNQGSVTYNTPPNTYSATFDLGLAPLAQPVIFLPTYTPNVTPIYAGTKVTFSEAAVGVGTLSYQWSTDGGSGAVPVHAHQHSLSYQFDLRLRLDRSGGQFLLWSHRCQQQWPFGQLASYVGRRGGDRAASDAAAYSGLGSLSRPACDHLVSVDRHLAYHQCMVCDPGERPRSESESHPGCRQFCAGAA